MTTKALSRLLLGSGEGALDEEEAIPLTGGDVADSITRHTTGLACVAVGATPTAGP
jgi:hypothetical protein